MKKEVKKLLEKMSKEQRAMKELTKINTTLHINYRKNLDKLCRLLK